MSEKLTLGLQKLGLEFSQTQIEQLEQYALCVLDFNQTYNLMKADSKDELIVNHILDSLAAVKTLQILICEIHAKTKSEFIQIADIGSGGGCPGIPLAVAFPEQKWILVERMEKRCAFLNDSIKKMKLQNVQVQCVQADLVQDSSFDIEVFRAFHPFDKKNTKLLLRMLKKGGVLVAYKARAEKILAEMEAIKFLVPKYEKVKLEVPFLEDHERHLVIVRK